MENIGPLDNDELIASSGIFFSEKINSFLIVDKKNLLVRSQRGKTCFLLNCIF